MKIGRPSKEYTEIIKIRIDKDLKSKIEYLAKKGNKSVSEYIREILWKYS